MVNDCYMRGTTGMIKMCLSGIVIVDNKDDLNKSDGNSS